MPDPRLTELAQVEEPFLRQLERLGWRVLRGDKYDPASTLRESFHEVILESELRAGLKQINPWLEDDQLDELIHRIQAPTSPQLLKANEEILGLLLEGVPVSENRQTREVSPVIRYIDFTSDPTHYSANNRFLAISQFKVKIPGTEKHIIPDIVLFVNGLPLVVVECKSPTVPDPLGEAITQLQRYANQRDGNIREGNEKLFWYNQFRIATFRQKACYTSLTGGYEDFIEWKDPYPYTLADIETEGSETVNSQQLLIQGMLTPQNLLDILHSFIVFANDSKGNRVKIVPRYQQYRAARKIVERLKGTGTPQEKSGIVWHTQGSGKSLTMMFAVRAIYHDPALTGYKIVFITDRTDLQTQLGGTANAVGYTLNLAGSIAALKTLLRTRTPDLVMGMIHKFQDDQWNQTFPELNDSPNIVVMIDEAHRTQYKMMGANLQVALPNAVRIAFTGTPIEKTERTFGTYIDDYSMRTALKDGVIVEIVYEGRTHRGDVPRKDEMNRRFEDVFQAVQKDERQRILNRYTWKAYLEAQEVIADKAEDMLTHYLAHVFPNRFKAQVVAVSRLAAIRYKLALDAALQRKIAELIAQNGDPEDLELLRKMRVEVVISGANNDEPLYKPYTDSTQHEKITDSFKTPFGRTTDKGIPGDVGIIVVQNMLITGFDAPVEQVMYLDNVIKEHNLLQAIARVNRVAPHKSSGFVVDYVGVAHHLREALSAYDEKEIQEILQALKESNADLDSLKFIHGHVKNFFQQYDTALTDSDTCVDVLADDEVRDEYIALVRAFSKAMDRVLPNPEALKFTGDLRLLAWISESARNRYRDEKLSIRDASRKIREIVDEFLVSKGVDPKIPPLPIFSEAFKARVQAHPSPRARAEEITHAVRQHINENYETDPELYDRLGEKLEKVLAEYQDNWDRLAKELEGVLEEAQQKRANEDHYGFHPHTELPFLALLKREAYGKTALADLPPEERERLIATTQDMLEAIRRETELVDFWDNYSAQKRLKSFLLNRLLMNFKQNRDFIRNRNQVAEKILELAEHNRPK